MRNDLRTRTGNPFIRNCRWPRRGRAAILKPALLLAGCFLAMLVAGCEGYGPIDQQIAMEKALWHPIQLTPKPTHAEPLIGASSISNHGLLPDVGPANRPGHYYFSLPSNVTSVRKMTPHESEYLIYWDALQNQSRPFITVVIARHPLWMSKMNPAFRITEKRSYVLNNLAATQVSGYYHGEPFTELVLNRFTPGSVLDALAIVKNAAERRAALKILDTMRWVRAGHD